MENLTGGTPPVRYLPCVVPCKLYFDAYQRTYIIESMDKTFLDVQYLYFFMDKYLETLRSQSIGD